MGKRERLILRIIPLVAVICFAAWCYSFVRPLHAVDDAEPEILNLAWRLAQGEAIYRPIDSPPYIHAAYPPVYFALTAALLKFTGLNFLPAKLISFISALAIGAALVALNRRANRSAVSATLMLALLFLLPAFFYNAARAHVQMTAVALSLWSFALFLRRDRGATVASALLAALAIYTKQTQVALPLALIVYLARSDRRRLIPYTVTLAVALLIPFFLLQRATGGWFFRHIVTLNALSYDASDIPLILLHHAGPFFLLIALAGIEVFRRGREGKFEEIDCYFAGVAVVTAIACGRLGAHTQYVVELCVVAAALLLMRGEAVRERVLVWQAALLMIYAPSYILVEEGRFARASNRAAPEVRRLLDTAPGPVLAQQSSFALASRGEIHAQLFHFTALARAGLWDGERLRREAAERYFRWVVTEFALEEDAMRGDDRERFTAELVEELRRNYRRAAVIGPYYIYQPVD